MLKPRANAHDLGPFPPTANEGPFPMTDDQALLIATVILMTDRPSDKRAEVITEVQKVFALIKGRSRSMVAP